MKRKTWSLADPRCRPYWQVTASVAKSHKKLRRDSIGEENMKEAEEIAGRVISDEFRPHTQKNDLFCRPQDLSEPSFKGRHE